MEVTKTKTCNSCKKILQVFLFNKNKSKKDGLNANCKECNKISSKKYYRANKSKHLSEIKRRKKTAFNKVIENVWNILTNNHCLHCGETNPLVLEFDHIDPAGKIDCISHLITGGNSWITIKKEIDKCQILCSNCHKKKSHKESYSWRYRLSERNKKIFP